MLKASELKNQQVVRREGVEYTVISNHVGDVLFLCNLEAEFYDGYHLFYDDPIDVTFASEFGIDLI
jgi:hypothetical protein